MKGKGANEMGYEVQGAGKCRTCHGPCDKRATKCWACARAHRNMAPPNPPSGPDPFSDEDLRQLAGLAHIMCTLAEVVGVMGIPRDRLMKRIKDSGFKSWDDFFTQHSSDGRASLRRRQFDMAMSGDKTLMIWLGKQVLGQADKVESVVESTSQILVRPLKELPKEDRDALLDAYLPPAEE